MAARAAKLKPCPPAGHSPAPYGTRGQCPTCKRRRCHGKARDGGRCRLFPVTAALVCRSHGAAKGTNGRKAAERRQQEAAVAAAEARAVRLFAADGNLDHREAALNEVGARYYAVQWLRREIAALDSLAVASERGESANVLLGLLATREKRLDEILRLCHDMKIDEQTQAREMANADRMDLLVHTLLGLLGLNPQAPDVRQAVRGALVVLEGGAS